MTRLLDAARRLRHNMGLPDQLRDAIRESLFGPAATGTENARQRAQAAALVVWLLGKTGAGKTAIIAALTGDPRAEVGLGFEPAREPRHSTTCLPRRHCFGFSIRVGLVRRATILQATCPGVRSNRIWYWS